MCTTRSVSFRLLVNTPCLILKSLNLVTVIVPSGSSERSLREMDAVSIISVVLFHSRIRVGLAHLPVLVLRLGGAALSSPRSLGIWSRRSTGILYLE